MGSFRSTKVFDGYSTCFRQWRADGTHCKFLHGYGVSVKIWFEGELDERNWVWDFGGMKRAKGTIEGMNPKDWMTWLLDHTTIVAEDDPPRDLVLDVQQSQFVQQVVLTDVTLVKVVGVILGIQVSIQKKVHLLLMTLSKFMTRIHTLVK